MHAKRFCSLLPLLAVFGVSLLGSAVALGQDEAAAAPDAAPSLALWIWGIWTIAPIGAIVALVFAWRFYHEMLR